MDTTRRGFLKLLGLTGAAVAVGGPSLFSGSAHTVPLIGASEHLVFDGTSPVLKPWSRAHYLFPSDAHGPASVLLMRDQRSFGSRYPLRKPPAPGTIPIKSLVPEGGWTPVGDSSSYTVNCVVPEGGDPHVAFFMAAAKLQDKIRSDVQELSKVRGQEGLTFVTMVDSPIMAYPHEDRGFYLETHISQFAAEKGDLFNADQALSKQGEVPIEAPNDISFKYLMEMEGELRRMGMLNENLHRVPWSAFQRAFQRTRRS